MVVVGQHLDIDDEFRDLIDPLSDDELWLLEANIIRDGCLDPIRVWNVPPVVLDQMGYGVCKECDSYKEVDPKDFRLGDGVWECARCGYGIAPLLQLIVDGHNRYEICKRNSIGFDVEYLDFTNRQEALSWIIDNQLGRRNISAYTRSVLALKKESIFRAKAKENQKGGQGGVLLCQKSDKATIDTKKEVAKIADVSHDTIAKVKKIEKAKQEGLLDEATIKDLRKGDKSINRVARDIDEAKKKKKREEQRAAAVKDTEGHEPQFFDNVHVGDFRDHFDRVSDNSLSLIFTDPPYDKKAGGLYESLGEFAASKLCEGGSLITYIGHIQMSEAFFGLSKHLRFWWPICCLHSGPEALMKEYGVRVGWKPALWFVKSTRDDKSNIVRDVMSGGREKSHHDWQQSQAEAEYWINELCHKDGIVCDPFLGGGTTVAAAIACNRKWVAFEKNHDQAVLAMSRIKGVLA